MNECDRGIKKNIYIYINKSIKIKRRKDILKKVNKEEKRKIQIYLYRTQ